MEYYRQSNILLHTIFLITTIIILVILVIIITITIFVIIINHHHQHHHLHHHLDHLYSRRSGSCGSGTATTLTAKRSSLTNMINYSISEKAQLKIQQQIKRQL